MDEDPMFNFLVFRDDHTESLAELDFITDLQRNPYTDYQTVIEYEIN